MVDRRYGDYQHDSELAPALSTPFIWNGSTRSRIDYVSQTDPEGGLICLDGSRTGYECSVEIDSSVPSCYEVLWNTYNPSAGSYHSCGLIKASTAFGTIAAVGGDSGGPVETPLSATNTEARGMLVAAGDPIFDPESAYYLPVRLTQDDDHVEVQMPIKQVGLAQLCMQAASNTEDSAITIATCNGNPGQIWNYGKDGTIKAYGKCLDVVQGVGPAVQLHHCNGTAAQVWHNKTNASSTQNPIYNVQTNECLDDPKQSQVVGTRLQVHSCNGTIAQYWNLPNQE